MEGLKKRVQEDTTSAEKGVEAAVDNVENRAQEKVEDAEKAAVWDVYGPHPSLALLTFWQGIVELCIGITVIVLSFAVLVAASVSVSDVSIDTTGINDDLVEMVEDSRSAAGFMVFVSLLAILFELVLISVRFFNFGAVNRFFLIFVVMVIIMVVIIGVFSFSGGVAAAVAGEEWQTQVDTWKEQGAQIYSRGYRIPKNLAATGAFGILTTLALALQGVWLILYLVFGWNKHMPTTSIVSGVISGVEKEAKSVF